MAAPAYTEDLTDIDLAESGSTGVAVNLSGGGGAAPAFGIDLAMQGAGCWDRQVSSHERGIAFNQTPGAPVVAAGVHIFQWLFVATPGITDTLQNAGAFLLCGTGTGNIMQFHVEGNDTYGAAGRVGKCYPFRYVTTGNASPPYRTVNGTPGATPTYFGAGILTLNSAKGSNLGVDAVRYGTGAYLTAGEIADPATFDGFATQNDAIANRWGILTKVGAGYELQGTFAIGQNNAGTPTLCYFEDSDVNISIVDTVHSETDFTKIIIDHASTTVKWTNVILTALGTHNRGTLTVNNDSSSVTVNGGTFTGIGTTQSRASCVWTGVTWRGCDQITRTGGDFIGCTIDKSTAAIAMTLNLPSALPFIELCEFISDGTGHAIDLGNVTSSQSVLWKNTESGYVAGTTGSPVVTGSSGNETLLVNVSSGQTLTINVAAGASVPSVKNDGTGDVNVVAGGVTIDVHVEDQQGVDVASAFVYLDDDLGAAGNLFNVTTDVNGDITQQSYNGASTAATLRVRKYGYKPYVATISLLVDTDTNVTLITDPQQT